MKTLDPTDIKILRLLQQDARQELSVISRQVYKSSSSVSERIRKMQERGIIKRYVAILDGDKIGRPLLAITQVRLSVHNRATLDEFAQQVNELPEVMLCLHLSGACDFILHIAVADTPAYHELLMNRICCNPYVVHVDTSFVLKECKTYGPFVF